MSNKRHRRDETSQPEVRAPDTPAEAKPESKPAVKKHLQCPLCWNGYGGKAKRRKWSRQVSGPLQQRCYVCDQCGTEWVVDVRADVIDEIERVEIKTSQVRKGDNFPPVNGPVV